MNKIFICLSYKTICYPLENVVRQMDLDVSEVNAFYFKDAGW